MERTLYIETNFAVGIAKGQDLAAACFLAGDATDIQIVIPSVCCMAAVSAWEQEQRQTRQWIESLSLPLRGVQRNLGSARAKRLVEHLEGARLASEQLLFELRARLDEALLRLSEDADFIEMERGIVDDAAACTYIPDPTDNLILCSILWHARRNSGGPKAFLSSNHHDFGQRGVSDALLSAGVKYFRKTEAALGWIQSQPLT